MRFTVGNIILFLFVARGLAEKCITPNNGQGECVSLYACPALIGALATQQKSAIEFVRQSNCGGTATDPNVCCSTSSFVLSLTTEDPKNDMGITYAEDELSNRRYCGFQHSDDYVRFNNSISLDEFPWLALLIYRDINENATNISGGRCSGTLISRRYILTAAHCAPTRDYVLAAVRLGVYNVEKQKECTENVDVRECSDPFHEVSIENITRHSMYSNLTGANDIALIRLSKAMQYSDYVRPICLPKPSSTANIGDTLTTSGWGRSSYPGDYVNIKKRISTKLISNEECTREYKSGRRSISENSLCTRELDDNREFSCFGDSGGPLMFSVKNQWQQEGIISFGKSCHGQTAEVHTKVVNYLEWIKENVIL